MLASQILRLFLNWMHELNLIAVIFLISEEYETEKVWSFVWSCFYGRIETGNKLLLVDQYLFLLQVSEAKMVWVDRLGFDMRLYSPPNGLFEIRIPFPREVTNEKGVKSTFNGMSQIAWEVEKNYYSLDFNRVKQFKKLGVTRL